jgi:hypothetical protein
VDAECRSGAPRRSFHVLYKTPGPEGAALRSTKDEQKAQPAASDYSSSLLTINRLEAALTSTQSYNVVSRHRRVHGCAPRTMRRCARLIDEICHDELRRRLASGRSKTRRAPAAGGQTGAARLALFGICLALKIKL